MITILLIAIVVLLFLIWLSIGGLHRATVELHGRLADVLCALRGEVEAEAQAIEAVDNKVTALHVIQGFGERMH